MLADILAFDFQRMERVHNYIQWLFPTEERSDFNRNAPYLSPTLQQAFALDPALRQQLRVNLKRFCDFLGFALQGDDDAVEIVVASHFKQRVPDCWSTGFGRSNHNWLRCSRVLNCLGLCSMPVEQNAFMACLETL